MCNVDGFNILYLEVFRLNLSSTQTTPTVSTLCPSWYTVIGRRRPAHPVSVLILHLTDTRTPWSQLFDIEIYCNALSRIKNATSCHPTGHVKKSIRTPATYLHWMKGKRRTKRETKTSWQKVKKKQHKIDKKPENREICMYVLRGTVRTAKKSKEPKTNTRPWKTTVNRTWIRHLQLFRPMITENSVGDGLCAFPLSTIYRR